MNNNNNNQIPNFKIQNGISIEKICFNKSGYKDGNKEEAQFNFPRGIRIDEFGNIYVCDSDNGCIRKLTKKSKTTPIANYSYKWKDVVYNILVCNFFIK